MTQKEKVLEIINDEIAQIRNMCQEDGENEISFCIRQIHYLAEAKAIKLRIFNELN